MSDHLPSEAEKSKPRAPADRRKRVWLRFYDSRLKGAYLGNVPCSFHDPKHKDFHPYVLKADADRLAEALRACKIRVPVDMNPPCEDGNLEAWKEAEAALAAYEGGGS